MEGAGAQGRLRVGTSLEVGVVGDAVGGGVDDMGGQSYPGRVRLAMETWE